MQVRLIRLAGVGRFGRLVGATSFRSVLPFIVAEPRDRSWLAHH